MIHKWEEGALVPVGRDRHTTVLHNGVICVGGGCTTDSDAVGGNDIYTLNSTATTWMNIGTLPVWMVGTTVVCDEQTQLVMIGGWDMDGKSTNKL